MQVVAEQQTQRVFAGCELERDLGLATAEVAMWAQLFAGGAS